MPEETFASLNYQSGTLINNWVDESTASTRADFLSPPETSSSSIHENEGKPLQAARQSPASQPAIQPSIPFLCHQRLLVETYAFHTDIPINFIATNQLTWISYQHLPSIP
uniref:Uncharacterized protein n=1 Tax=Romanomermis culicivorax TaxID=13658 RepID=A0A915JC50_ROMCU